MFEIVGDFNLPQSNLSFYDSVQKQASIVDVGAG